MKTSRILLLGGVLLAHCCFSNAQSTNDIRVSVSPSSIYAGDSVTVSWSLGTNVLGPNDWVSVYRTGTPDPAPGNTAVATSRASTVGQRYTTVLPIAGTYEVRYVRLVPCDPVMYQALARSPILSVIAVTNPIITLSTNRIIVRTTATIRWIMGTNVVGPNDWISLYRTDVPDPAPLGTATAGVLASTSGHEWTYLFTVPGTYEARYVRANATNTVVPSIARSPILTVQEPVVDATLIRNYPSAGGNIIAVGDNLVRGTNATPDEDFVSELIRRLCCRAVLNKGVAGDTTSNVLARLQTDVLSQNPKIVIIMLGGDFLHGIPTSTTLGNLRNIIAQVHAAGAIVVLVGVQGGSFGTSFASSYQQLADESGCAYIPDVLRGIVGNSALMSTDVMPNNEGYEAIAKRVAPTVAVLDAAPAQPLAAAALPQQRMVELTWGQIIGTEYVLSAGTTATFADGAPILSIKRVGDTLVIGVRPSGQQGFFRLEPVLPPAESP